MWNSFDLHCPLEDLAEYSIQDRTLVEELKDFVTVLTTSADILTSENPLWDEMKVLRNIQVKYKRILKCDRSLIFLQRVGHCLRKMVLLNLSKSYLDLAERFLNGFQKFSTSVCLPSRQQVEYVLVRTLSASRLICEAITYSRESFCYLIQKLKVGHLILDLVMATSVTARLNILLRATLEKLCSTYNQVLVWRCKVKTGEFQWVEKFQFPEDIEEWLKTFEPAYLKPLSMSKEDIKRVKSVLNQATIIQGKKQESDSESVVIVNEVPNNGSSNTADVTTMDADYGEVIPRKKAKINHDLTNKQKSLLQKVVQVQSLKGLENLWCDIRDLSQDNFPRVLMRRKKEVIDELFSKIKEAVPNKRFSKTFKNDPPVLRTPIFVFCRHLGFTKDQIKMCKDISASSNVIKVSNVPRPLAPVKSVKKLKRLYEQLKRKLEFKNETDKLQLLKKIFKCRRTEIKLLKQKGERSIAKKLTLCTSEEFLALCQ